MSVSADVYYHLALAKCHMEQHGHAIFYANEDEMPLLPNII